MGAPAIGDPLDALPPRSGYRRRSIRPVLRGANLALDAIQGARRLGPRLDSLAANSPRRSVLVLGVYRPGRAENMRATIEEVGRSGHEVEIRLGCTSAAAPALSEFTAVEDMAGGKLANLNLLSGEDGETFDWFLLLDDDIRVPRGFLDRLLAVAERFELDLAQPALTAASHSAFPITRRRLGVARETWFVEVGPAVLMSGDVHRALTPFPEEGMGWGVCLTWAAEARRLGWRLGIIDAVPVRHELAPPGASYDTHAARSAARELLRSREHLDWREACRVVATHRSL